MSSVEQFDVWWTANRRPGWAGNTTARLAAQAAWEAALRTRQAGVDGAVVKGKIAALNVAYRNCLTSEITERYKANGARYEAARAYAEADVIEFEDKFLAAIAAQQENPDGK